jgi:hypothetical protein
MTDTSEVEHLQDFPREVFHTVSFELSPQQIVDYAQACGEQAACYTDPSHPDFQAPPTFPSSVEGVPRLPDDFSTPPGLGMDAGRAVTRKSPIRPGVPLTGHVRIHDVYTKTGRSGKMTFVVTRMEIYDPAETLLATTDTRIVFRERPAS